MEVLSKVSLNDLKGNQVQPELDMCIETDGVSGHSLITHHPPEGEEDTPNPNTYPYLLSNTQHGFQQLHITQLQSALQATIDRHLPEAQTCFFTLSLPSYSSENILREKLLQAITSCKAIDTDFMVQERSSLTPPTTDPPDRRHRRQLLRSKTRNSSDHSHQDSSVILSEDTLSFLDTAFNATS